MGLSESDYANQAVPLSARRSSGTMGLLWITMVTGFPTVLIGFEWYKKGLTLSQVLVCVAISGLLLLLYTVAASQLGARTGLSYGSLSRMVFGQHASHLVTFNLIWIFVAWYGLTSLYFAEGLIGLFHWRIPLMIMAVTLAMMMAFNNFFGFKGVANFARYFASPILILWVAYTFCKAVHSAPALGPLESSGKSFQFALTTISTFVIGYGVWGNEADYWRHGKPGIAHVAPPLAIALLIGLLIFPATGYLLAHMTGITEYGAATSFMNDFSFAGLAIVGAIILTASYTALNDSNLLGTISAAESIKTWSHRGWVFVIAALGAATAGYLSYSGAASAVEAIASINCIVLPTATVIMGGEWFASKLFGSTPLFLSAEADSPPLPKVRWPALIALIIGITTGLVTSGLLPGTQSLQIGIASINAWITGFIVYVCLRMREIKADIYRPGLSNLAELSARRSLEKALDKDAEAVPTKR